MALRKINSEDRRGEDRERTDVERTDVEETLWLLESRTFNVK